MVYWNRKSLLRPTKDHVVAKSKGGQSTIPVCYECNHSKAANSLVAFLSTKYPTNPMKIYNILTSVEKLISTPRDRYLFELENYFNEDLQENRQKKRANLQRSREALLNAPGYWYQTSNY